MSDVRRKVFISWSGDASRSVASKLRDWLPLVLQNTVPFMSDQDIAKGSRGDNAIAEELRDAALGIICLTPQNLEAPWILFEAGALSNSLLANELVCPYLIGLKKSDVRPPLSLFQITAGTRKDTKRLIETINRTFAPDLRLQPAQLDRQFDMWWPELASVLEEAITTTTKGAPEAPARSSEDILLEVLQAVRRMERGAADRQQAEWSALEEAMDEDGTSVPLGFGVGDLVEHPTFGRGTVKEISGFGRNIKALVDFQEKGLKKLLVRYAEVNRVPPEEDV